jgi:DNA-binding CsgD family transcriptional regulator
MPTVKTHIGNLIAKTGASDRVHLVLFALRMGIASL